MKNTKSTARSTTRSTTKSMSSKKPSLKKYEAGAIVTDDKDKGKGKKSTATKYINRMNQGIDDAVSKVKSFIPTGVKNYGKSVVKDVKDTYKKVEGAALDKLDRVCNPNTDTCSYKKGGVVVGKSRRK